MMTRGHAHEMLRKFNLDRTLHYGMSLSFIYCAAVLLSIIYLWNLFTGSVKDSAAAIQNTIEVGIVATV